MVRVRVRVRARVRIRVLRHAPGCTSTRRSMYARARGDSIRASVRSASGCRSSRHVRALVRVRVRVRARVRVRVRVRVEQACARRRPPPP